MTQTTETPKTPERRTLDVAEMRTEGKKLAGYAAVFDSLSSDLGGFRERIVSGAFSDVLGTQPDVHLVLNHDDSQVLARTKSGTLRLAEDQRGLAFEADLPNSPLGDNVRESVRRGDIDGASFRFVVGSESWDDTGELRTINNVAELFDVTVATRGAYPAAHVELRTESTTNPKEKTTVDDNSTEVVEERSTATNDDEPLEETRAERRGTLRVEDADAVAETTPIEDRVRSAIKAIRKGEVRALSDSSAHLSPVEYATYIFDRLRAQSVLLRSGVRVIPTDRQSFVFPALTADATPGWYAEGATFTEADPTLTALTATPKKIGHIVAMSNELIDDSDPSALDVIQQNLLKIMALFFDQAAFQGDGTSNSIVGLKNVSGIATYSMGTNGATPTDLNPISEALQLLESYNAVGPFAVVMHPRTWNTLRELKDSYGRYILNPQPVGPNEYSVFGNPVYVTSQLSITETQGSASTCSSIYVYEPDQVVVVLRQDVQVELDRSRLFNADQSEMRARFRADLLVPNAGAVCRILGVKP